MGYEHYSPTAGMRSPMLPTPDAPRSNFSWRQSESLPRIHEDVLCRPWQQAEPYMAERQSVIGNEGSYPPRRRLSS